MWSNDLTELNTGRFSGALGFLLDAAMERAVEDGSSEINECDLLYCLLTHSKDGALFAELPQEERLALSDAASLLANYLAPGVRIKDCVTAFKVSQLNGGAAINPFLFESFRPPLGELIDGLPDGAEPGGLLGELFGRSAELADGELIRGLFRTDELNAAIFRQSSRAELFDARTGLLIESALKPRCLYITEQALAIAARGGEAQAQPLHIMAAVLELKESYFSLLLRKGGGEIPRSKLTLFLRSALRAEEPASSAPGRNRDSFSPEAVAIYENALRRSLSVGQESIGERELLMELLPSEDAKLRYLTENVLGIDAAYYLQLAADTAEPDEIEPLLPVDICECRCVSGGGELVERDDALQAIVKVFFRKTDRNVLLYGEEGVGLTTVARLLAKALREGKYPSLRALRVLWFDLRGLAQEDYDRAAERLMRFIEEEPERIYVVEGFCRYFKARFSSVSGRLRRGEARLLLLAGMAEYNELSALGSQLSACVETLRLSEPNRSEAQRMTDAALPAIEREYGVDIARGVSQAAYRMANDYLISSRFPKKAIELIARTAADVAAEAEMRGQGRPTLKKEDLARRMSAQTGLPAETILGTGGDKDYAYLLSQTLVGQDAAVSKVAGRLDLIQKGMVDKKAPAAVFLFAGLSGTGKTELAKQIAQIYSSSRKLITFAMANFGEAHSVSRLIGTPPGYVGYEEGGKLINDLNNDPYSVVLLDAIEKANPAVWDPFLNLFDEGVITDMRGVSASGSKAFFVLTSNIGQYDIASMLRAGRPVEEIEETVKNRFSREKHPKTGELCFRPEFIGRIMRRGGIVVFNALSLEALQGIAGHMFSKVAREYGEVHEGRLVCDEDVIEMISRQVYEANEQAIERGSGYFGGRQLDILMNQYVDNKIASQLRQLAGVPLVRIVRDGSDTAVVPVYSDSDAQELLSQKRAALVDRVSRRFDRLTMLPADAFAELSDDRLSRLNMLLSEIDVML